MKVLAEGKTKVVYQDKSFRVKIVSKDQITAGDGEKKDVIGKKGVLANKTTCNVFRLLEREGIRTHFVRRQNSDSFLARHCQMIPIEVVIRRSAKGSYLKRNPKVEEGTVFSRPIVEFFYKDDASHDPIILIENGVWNLYDAKKPLNAKVPLKKIAPLLQQEEVKLIRGQASEVFVVLERAWRKLNVDLIDLKIEFGRRIDNGRIVVADVIDNDSWRIAGEGGRQMDKQLYRDGKSLSEVARNYRIVAELTEQFVNF